MKEWQDIFKHKTGLNAVTGTLKPYPFTLMQKVSGWDA